MHGLLKMGKLGDNFSVVGVARKQMQREEFVQEVKSHIKSPNETAWNRLSERLYYYPLEFEDHNGFNGLGNFLGKIETKYDTKGNRLFYLATLPQHFKNIAYNLRKGGLAETKGWCRVVFEKPFGSDEKSARELNNDIAKVFDEDQIYRIDHYLGKELVQSIGIIRAGNRIFTPLWDNKNIDHVQVNLIENFGVENRGNFYDAEGALKDVGQNHMLQLLALTTMEIPEKFDEKCIRNEKVKILKSIEKIKTGNVVLGQYDGYHSEKGIVPNSRAETFFAVKMFIKNKRWKGVPIYLRSGKNLGLKFASIYIQFKETHYTVFENQNLKPNYMVIQIQPDDGMLLQLNGKIPGEKMKVQPVKMTFCHECAFGPNTPQAYETLIYDAIAGDQSAFIRADEIEHSWKVIDQITKKKLPVRRYEKGSFGPKEADEMIKKDGREWFNKIENVVQGL